MENQNTETQTNETQVIENQNTETQTNETQVIENQNIETQTFEIPEKFKGKSLEDVIKSYVELEKFKKVEEKKPISTEERSKKINEIATKYINSNEISEEDKKTLS